MNNTGHSDIKLKRSKSDSVISYCNFCRYDKNESNKISKSNSLNNQIYSVESQNPSKILKTKSFTMSLSKRQFFRCYSDSMKMNQDSVKYSVCLCCNQKFDTNNNKFCSLQCYKISKKDHNGIYHIKCNLCNKSFHTKCILTDYCSQKCFQDI
jgi:hypothetical protein